MTAEVPLLDRLGHVIAITLVDDQDFELVAGHTWRLRRSRSTSRPYAARGRGGRERMHRVIMGLGSDDPREVDHLNRDTLDNRRSNLRLADDYVQTQNRSKQPGTTSRYRGVSWDRSKGRWRVEVIVFGRKHRLGRFRDEDEAGAVAQAFRLEHMLGATD